jgi:citrate synthase
MPTLTADQAAKRLGVKVETLYAYVSRGILEAHRGEGRASHYDSRDIEALARRGRPRQSSRDTSLNMLIETRLTQLSAQGVRYRGHLTSKLATSHTFEQVADLLWLGELSERHDVWQGSQIDGLDGLPLLNAIQVIAAMATPSETDHTAREPANVAKAGRDLIATIIDSLPLVGDGRVPRLVLPHAPRPIPSTAAARLWSRLSPQRPTPRMLVVLNAAMVLMADHELATSTLGVRVAASTHADPYAVVSAGLGVLRGPLHGGASIGARNLLDHALRDGAARAIAAALKSNQRLPGFGHKVYVDADPRATVLLDLLRVASTSSRLVTVADDVIAEARKRIDRAPNVDFTLALLTIAADMAPDAGEAAMAIARIAGWLAHAIEEYHEAPLRFRPRASYIGPSGAAHRYRGTRAK